MGALAAPAPAPRRRAFHGGDARAEREAAATEEAWARFRESNDG